MKIDNIELYNGNNLDVLKMLNLDYSKCIFVSDPPFNIGYHYNKYNDKMSEDDYYNWLFDIFGTYKQVIIHYPEYLYKHAFNIGLFPEKVVSWVYNSNTGKQHRDIAFFGIKPDFKKIGQAYKNPNDKRIAKRILEGKRARLYDWWEINQVKNVSSEKTSHPCQMPLKVMENIIGILPDNYTIIDPFLGSGTTALACKKFNRKFIGIELDEKYFEISKNRILNYTSLFD
jgi:DNA modification methylase